MQRRTRRDFLQSTAALGAGLWVAARPVWAESRSANETLNIAGIGVGGRGASDVAGVESENIVALCDVDEQRAAGTFDKFPHAKKYRDFRVMLEKEKSIDAVVVATPDHVHAPASIMAMRLGKHVYCEKPLTHSIYEARRMRELAEETGVTTQMGNQGHSNDGSRRSVELIRGGIIGNVKEVHCWTDRPIWPQGADALAKHAGVQAALTGVAQPTPVPSTLDWDLWLGPAAERPYAPVYLPFNWRGWWDFGTGALGDMACHIMDMPFWALELDNPVSVSAVSSEVNPYSAPLWSKITYEFAARGARPAVTLTWYDGGKKPSAELVGGRELDDNGTILVGEKATMLVTDAYGASFNLFVDGKEAAGFESAVPESLPRSPGHHKEWILACKGGPASLSNFSYSGPLTEMVLLGNLAVRLGKKIAWDAANLRSPDTPEATALVRREYREGWSL